MEWVDADTALDAFVLANHQTVYSQSKESTGAAGGLEGALTCTHSVRTLPLLLLGRA